MAVIRNDPEATKPSPLKPFPSGIGSKRRHPSPTEQEVFYTTQEERQVPPVKKRRGKSKLIRHWLLRGVEVYDRHAQMAQQFVPAKLVSTMAASRVDSKFLYSFSLEHQVLKLH